MWKDAEELYKGFIKRYGWKQEPMLEFVLYAKNHELSRHWQTWTSHHWLLISLTKDYRELRKSQHISIVYGSKESIFTIKFLEKMHSTAVKKQFPEICNDKFLSEVSRWLEQKV